MSQNMPSSTDQPFAIHKNMSLSKYPFHRFDYGSPDTREVCVFLSAGDCVRPPPFGKKLDYNNCTVRCWGYGYTGTDNVAQDHLEAKYYTQGQDNQDTYRTQDGDSWVATDVWSYAKTKDPGVPADKNLRAKVEDYGDPRKKDADGNFVLGFNPQGFVYTFAGKTERNDQNEEVPGDNYGYMDGPSEVAMFRGPQDVAVDRQKNVYVADTDNNCIRKVDVSGNTTTIAGVCGLNTGGSDDGAALAARFARPSGVTVYYDWSSVNATGALVIFVADTDNHRIRRIDCIEGWEGKSTVSKDYKTKGCTPTVMCWAGRCGNGTFSYTLSKMQASVAPGLADGPGDVARFDSPRGIEADDDGVVYVADTNNHLIRAINQSAWVFTLAGKVEVQEADEFGNPVPGCPPPCIKGVPGFKDGNLTNAEFYYPADVTMGGNWTLLVSDKMRIRRVTFPKYYFKLFWEDNRNPQTSKIRGIATEGRVVTIAGQRYAGVRDGPGPDAEFMDPEAVSMGKDGIIFILDSGTCRLRRLMPGAQVAEKLNCTTKGVEVIRPSGCTSYDPPVDSRDVMASAVQGNIYYNYYDRLDYDAMDGSEPKGRSIKDCTGSPPPYFFEKRFWNETGDNLAIDDGQLGIQEDTNDGMRISLMCPLDCKAEASGSANRDKYDFYGGSTLVQTGGVDSNGDPLYGRVYSDESSVCMAAEHAGMIDPQELGLVTMYVESGMLSLNESNNKGVLRNDVTSKTTPYGHPRLFQVGQGKAVDLLVSSIAGRPAALLESPCGYADGQPMQMAMFNVPQGMGMFVNSSLTEEIVLFIADTKNNLIRAVSAGCGQICENAGRCVGADICECAKGWYGHDCTLPICSEAAPLNMICVAPETFACIPGYSGDDCNTPLCNQVCYNGGKCMFPDTCACEYGWWDANCTTPVCSQTCGNGGNCTGPDTCACPKIWSGPDCRKPVCDQVCKNGGQCIAPNTCLCPPQWSGHDCALPVCNQGYFEVNTEEVRKQIKADPYNLGRTPYPNTNITADLLNLAPRYWAMYRPCFYELFCNATNEFDCKQPQRRFLPIEPPSEQLYPGARNITGRKTRPTRCTEMELGEDVITNLQYFQSRWNSPDDLDPTTGYARYTPKTPYYWDSNPKHPWSAIDKPTEGKTPPFYHASDRHVAAVEWHNVTQGVYVCANGGKCVAPDTCQCGAGWMGFDCRTPICSQGFHVPTQERYVSGTKITDELRYFEPFMSKLSAEGGKADKLLGRNFGASNPDYETLRLDWEYSNPNYTMHWEYFVNKTHRASEVRQHGNERYLSRLGSNVWSNQEGSVDDEELHAIGTNSQGDVVFGGHTLGSLSSRNKARDTYDVFIGVYDKNGVKKWEWQNGTQVNDVLFGAKFDPGDYIFAGGHTEGNMNINVYSGKKTTDESGKINYDIWMSRWQNGLTGGTEQWRLQFGTTGNDYLYALTTTSSVGEVIVGGTTNGGMDAFCAKFTALDSGTCTKDCTGDYGCKGYNIWFAKFENSGTGANQNGKGVWAVMLGTDGQTDKVDAIYVDPDDNIYLAGTTTGTQIDGSTPNPAVGSNDIWIAKYDKFGSKGWITQFGSEGMDYVSAIAVNSKGETFFGGATASDLGTFNIGAQDIIFGKLSTTGALVQDRPDGSKIGGSYQDGGSAKGYGYVQFGTEVIDYLSVLTVDSKDNVIIGGHTGGDMVQVNKGLPPSTDVWYAKYTEDLYQIFIDQYGTDGYDYISDMTFWKANNKLMSDNAIMGGYTSGRFGPVHTGKFDYWVSNYTFMTFQGGYQCSVRSVTQWERVGPPHLYQYVLEHPNYFSAYMNPKVEKDGIQYSNWTGMQWPAVHEKTAPLYIMEDLVDFNLRDWTPPTSARKPGPILSDYDNTPNMYIYTNEGHRLDGIWEVTGEGWVKGTCVVEFNRTCASGPAPKDLYTGLPGMVTQDTDLSFRPRIMYGQFQVYGEGRWFQEDRGDCVDNVVRGCFNNGTCVAPDTCQCAQGWSGFDCTTPICPLGCAHNGNCTLPGICTCELGWEGDDCMKPTCAQECVNGGKCVAPDTCQCRQWPMSFYDMAVPAKPLYQKPKALDITVVGGEPQLTGYTGFDCSVPICVQANSWEYEGGGGFYINVDDFARNIKYVLPLSGYQTKGYREGAGQGPDGVSSCADVRCPFFDEMVINNLGQTFQSGCGFDPLFGTQIGFGNVGGGQAGGDTFADGDTDETLGCCLEVATGSGKKFLCRRCIGEQIEKIENYTCVMDGDYVVLGSTYTSYKRTILDMALKPLPSCYGDDGAGNYLNGIAGETCVDSLQSKADSLLAQCNLMKPFCSVETDPNNANYEGFVIENIDSYTQVTTKSFRLCGPTNFFATPRQELKQRPFMIQPQPRRNKTSNDFLCSIKEWWEGDYLDDGNLNDNHPLVGVGVEYDTRPAFVGTTTNCREDGYELDQNGRPMGNRPKCTGFPGKRHIRRNHANITYDSNTGKWEYRDSVPGEGVYFCPKGGSCIAPDTCTCADGYAGYACNIPLCRHLQKIDSDGNSYVSSCLNGGVCALKDDCHCIQTKSLMYTKYPDSPAGLTGYTGADCSMPMCVQGFYDPYCTNLPEAPGGEGCFRCSNGGNCTAPDTCTCAEGWTGYDCKTPICEVRRSKQIKCSSFRRLFLFLHPHIAPVEK